MLDRYRTRLRSYSANGAPPPPTLPLDNIVAENAYGLRKLRNSYSGACLRVRRGSDNVELDVGFVGQQLDTTTLTNFKGASQCYVVVWYDQSGNNRNTSIKAVIHQPEIINQAGVWRLKFNGTSSYIDVPLTMFPTSNFSISVGGKFRGGNPYFAVGFNYGLDRGYLIKPSGTTALNFFSGVSIISTSNTFVLDEDILLSTSLAASNQKNIYKTTKAGVTTVMANTNVGTTKLIDYQTMFLGAEAPTFNFCQADMDSLIITYSVLTQTQFESLAQGR